MRPRGNTLSELDDRRARQILLLTLAAGTLIRLFFAWQGNLNLDEGQWLYDIHLLQEGALPFVDWTTRAPLLLAVSALFTKVFGYYLFVGRLVSVCAATGTAYLLYRIGSRGASRKVGLAAASLFSLSPFVIYQTIIVHEHPLQELLVAASILFLLRALQRDSNGDAFLHGLILSLAFLVRRSSPIYFFAEPILLLMVLKKPLPVLRKLIYIGLGATLGLTPLIPFVMMTNLRWMWIVYGAGGLAVSPPPAEDYDWANILFNAIFFLTPHYTLLVIGAGKELLAWIEKVRYKRYVGYALLILAVGFFLSLTPTESWTDRYNTIPTTRFEGYLVAIILAGGLICAKPRFSRIEEGPDQPLGMIAWFWLGTTILFYTLIKQRWILDYSMELVIPVCLLSAMAIFSQWKGDKECALGGRIVAITLLIAHTALTSYIVAYRPTYARSWSHRHANAVGDYVASRTEPGEEIFTADTVFAVTAQRPLVLDMSHPALYYMLPGSDPYPYDPFEVVPDMTEIIRYLEKHRVEYIPAGWRTEGLMTTFPRLSAFVQSHYTKEAIIGDKTTIYKRRPENTIALPAPDQEPPPQAEQAVYFQFGYQVELLGYSVITKPSPGNNAVVALYWRSLAQKLPPLRVEGHLLRPDGEPLAKTSGDLPASDVLGEIYRQELTFSPTAYVDTPTYAQIKLVLRRDDTGQQLASFDRQQNHLKQGALFGSLRVTGPEQSAPLGETVGTFGELASLVDYSIPGSLNPGKSCQISLTWQAHNRTPVDYSVFVHLIDSEGKIIAQEDDQPKSGRFPTSLWRPGDVVVDSHQLDIPSDLDPQGTYRVLVGFYRLDDMTRLPATDAEGQPVPNDSLSLGSCRP